MRGLEVLILLLALLSGFSSASAASPGKIISTAVSNAASSLLKRLWSLKSTPKTAISGHRPLMKFEGGYTVETVFDGSKLGIEPYSVEVTQNGELLLLDSVNSNLYRIAQPLSRYSRPKLIAGSPEGYVGHVDGRPREARMNHPRGFAVDGRGNIYIADTTNMAIRKISDADFLKELYAQTNIFEIHLIAPNRCELECTGCDNMGGVTTIAGGKWSRGGHSDGPSEDAKFSTDFEVVYIASSCSLLVVDRGDQAIREIQLHFDDCAQQYETGFPLGVAVLLAAGFFGYMLALLQRRVGVMVSSNNDFVQEPQTPPKASMPPYQKPMKPSMRPPLIPVGSEAENMDDEGLFSSMGKLLFGAWSSTAEIFAAMFPIFRKKPKTTRYQQQQRKANTRPMSETYVIPNDEMPPPVETKSPSPHKTYAFMSKEPERIHHIRQARTYFTGWDAEPQQQQRIHRHQHLQQHQHHSSGPQTYYEQSCDATNEIVFGAVQELNCKRKSAVIKTLNYGDPIYEQHGLRFPNSYMGYDNY